MVKGNFNANSSACYQISAIQINFKYCSGDCLCAINAISTIRYRVCNLSLSDNLSNQFSVVLELHRLTILVDKVVAFYVVAVHQSVAHQCLSLGESWYVVVQSEQLRLRQYSKYLAVIEYVRTIFFVRDTKVCLVKFLDYADHIPTSFFEKQVDTNYQRASSVIGNLNCVGLVDHALVQVTVYAELKCVWQKCRLRELRRCRVFVICVLISVGKANEPCLQEVLLPRCNQWNNRWGFSRWSLNNQNRLSAEIILIGYGVSISSGHVDKARWIVIVGEEQQVVVQVSRLYDVNTSNEELRIEV